MIHAIPEVRERMRTDAAAGFSPFLAPRGIAVLDASSNRNPIGGRS
ncbi:MAG: hypothetical protein OEZ08_05380 [Betaproteobacteria bacterium]|nr:hypothetical protein [Betaproteobacteria bacterium]